MISHVFSPETHDEFGRPKFVPTAKPSGTHTYFCGADDNGVKIKASMTAEDLTQEIDLVFDEDVYIVGGNIATVNAPFGATMDFQIVHPTEGVVSQFGQSIQLIGTGRDSYLTHDRAPLAQGLKVRIKLSNGDTPAAWQFVGNLLLFRATTI
jgi:hypothetical protein